MIYYHTTENSSDMTITAKERATPYSVKKKEEKIELNGSIYGHDLETVVVIHAYDNAY